MFTVSDEPEGPAPKVPPIHSVMRKKRSILRDIEKLISRKIPVAENPLFPLTDHIR